MLPGTRLGVYEITATIGAGGIGKSIAREVTPEGNRFLFVRPQGDDQISVMLNWQAALPKKE